MQTRAHLPTPNFRAFMAGLALLTAVLFFSLPALAQSATPPSGTFTASPSSGAAPLAVTVTWNVANTVGTLPCTASGLWTGAKPASGTQSVTVNASGTFSLLCTGATESVTISWTNAAFNSDGTAYTNPASVKIYNSKDGSTYGVTVNVPAPTNTYTWANLTAGVNYWKLTSISTLGAESAPTTPVQKTLQTLSTTFTAPVTTTTVPNPPSGVAVTIATTAWDLKGGGALKVVGVVKAPGLPCGDFIRHDTVGELYEIALKYVDLTSQPRPGSKLATVCAVPLA